MIDVIIVDDHPIVRAGIRTVLDAADDVTVVAEGATGDDALRLVEQHRPDVLVLDVNLPDMNGLDVVRRLREREITTAILVLTMHADSHTVFGLLKARVSGYVLKDEAPEMLAGAVQAVAQGQNWFSPAVSRQVMRRAVGQTASSPESLTPREMEVLRLLAQGLDNTTIAQQLVITRRTVQNHVSSIYGKLGVDSRIEAALYAVRHGLARVWEGQ